MADKPELASAAEKRYRRYIAISYLPEALVLLLVPSALAEQNATLSRLLNAAGHVFPVVDNFSNCYVQPNLTRLYLTIGVLGILARCYWWFRHTGAGLPAISMEGFFPERSKSRQVLWTLGLALLGVVLFSFSLVGFGQEVADHSTPEMRSLRLKYSAMCEGGIVLWAMWTLQSFIAIIGGTLLLCVGAIAINAGKENVRRWLS